MEKRETYLARLAWDLASRCFTIHTLTTLANIDHLDEEQKRRAREHPAKEAAKWGKRRSAEWKKEVGRLSVFQIIDSFGKYGAALRRNLGKEYHRAFIMEADVISLLYVYAVVSGVDFDDLIEAWMPVHLALRRLLGMIDKGGKKRPLQFAYFVQDSPEGMTPAALFLQRFIQGKWGADDDDRASGYLGGFEAYEGLEESVGDDKAKVAARILEGKDDIYRAVFNAIARGEYRTETDEERLVSLEKPIKEDGEGNIETLGDTLPDTAPLPDADKAPLSKGEWADILDLLTPGEREIVTRLFLGHTKIAIAQALDMSRPTLDSRLEGIKIKLIPLAKELKIIN
jgi:hypothetical protein